MPDSVVELLPAPPRDALESVMTDWLELGALLTAPKPFALLALIQALDLDVDADDPDPETVDQFREDLFQKIGNEIERRQDALNTAYPFQLSTDGHFIETLAQYSDPQISYLISLLLSHCAKGGLLPKKLRPSDDRLYAARDLFQICSTVAAAGHTKGPSFSLGHPRPDGSSLHDKLKTSWSHFGDGEITASIHPDIPAQHKDEGIDVLSFWKEKDKGPSQGYLVGQVASGANWKDKSAAEAAQLLKTYWLSKQPVSKSHTATFIPFDVPQPEMNRTTVAHGYIISRLRLPAKLLEALELSKGGLQPIERICGLSSVRAWVDTTLTSMRQATS